MAKQRDRSREVFWRRTLRRQARSGMTIAEFCESEGLNTTTFHYWRREIKRRDADSPPADAAPEFAAVQLVDDHVCGAPVEIVVENGYVIRVSEQATSEHLRRVLQALNELRREAR